MQSCKAVLAAHCIELLEMHLRGYVYWQVELLMSKSAENQLKRLLLTAMSMLDML